MPLQIVRNDITKMRVDAIVNAANESLLGGGGVDGCIHRAAGPQLLAECRALGGCETGQAKLTGGYRLPCKYVIHAVGPRWRGGAQGERQLLRACYQNALALAAAHDCETVAFPLISSGIYGYPKDQALQVAVETISAFLAGQEREMTVYLVIFDRAAYQIGETLFADIAAYIDDRYVEEHRDPAEAQRGAWGENTLSFELPAAAQKMACAAPPAPEEKPQPPKRESPLQALFGRGKKAKRDEAAPPFAAPGAAADVTLGAPAARQAEADAEAVYEMPYGAPYAQQVASAAPRARSLDEELRQMDESFSEMLLRKIDESGLTDVQCYKKANIDRKLFSKIRSDKLYRPSKPTALAFAIALELPLPEAKELLEKAGFALSRSSKFDIIVEYFIRHGNYNVFEINEALFAFDQSLLG